MSKTYTRKDKTVKAAKAVGRGVGIAGAAALFFGAAYVEAVADLEEKRERAEALNRDFLNARVGDRFEVVGDYRSASALAGYGRIDVSGGTAMVDGKYVGNVYSYRVVRYGRTVRTVN